MSIEVVCLLAVLISGMIFVAVVCREPRTEVGDDTVNIFCAHCDGDAPWRDCGCIGDCGRRRCPGKLISDEEFRREVAALLDAEADRG